MEALYNLGVMVSIIDKFTGPVRKMTESLASFENQAQKAHNAIELGNKMAISGALFMAASAKITGSLSRLLAPTVGTQRALGELASVGITDFDALSRAAQNFSSQWSGTTEADFLSAAYDIKSGISSLSDAAVGEFTAMAALTGKATKSTTGEMTSLFATGYGIYKDLYSDLSDMDFGEIFSAGIAGSVQNFKTTGGGMSQALTSLGAAGATALRPLEEQLSILGMLQATMPGGEAGTKYKAFLASAAKAGDGLGLSFVDSNNQLLGMADILDALRGKYGDTLDAMEKQEIAKAFGTQEAVALVDLLYGKVGDLRGNVDQLGMSMRQGTAFTEGMAQAMNDDIGASLDLLGQNSSIIKRIIGDELGGLLQTLVPTAQAGVQSMQRFVEANPVLMRIILLVSVITVGLLTLAAITIATAAGLVLLWGYTLLGLNKIWKALKWTGGRFVWFRQVGWSALRLLSAGTWRLAASLLHLSIGVMPGVIAAAWGFTVALLANPITWIILAIIALIAALVLLWRNWDTVKAYVLNAITNTVAGVKAKFGEWRESGKGLIEAFTGGIQAVINKPAEVVKSGLQKLRNLLPFSDAREGPLSSLTRSGMALIETFAGGIQQRAPMLRAVTVDALGGAGLSGDLGYGYRGPGLGGLVSSITKERETHIRDRRPIVMVLPGATVPDNLDSAIDEAYRFFDMRDE
ncbi:MAG: phage tail tape measure protein [Eubacteriales bacterium]|nr:phage tail tape measure protein [Eubacteriales bacterium]